MFDRIAPRYDLVNRVLSFRRDVAWRRKLAKHLPAGDGLLLLDLATGTGDQIFHLLERTDRIARAIGLDLSEGMLAEGQRKIGERGLADQVELRIGDANTIPIENASTDIITISFGIRNVTDVAATLRNMHRVLRPGGRVLILEFSLPRNPLIRGPYLFYFRHILPRIGGTLSGDAPAYRYLNQTVETFPYGESFCDLMREAGLKNVQAHPLSFGIATLYQGDRSGE